MAAQLKGFAALISLALASSGCANSAPPAAERVPVAVDVVLIAGARLNLDEQGESLPTLVRIYQLKGTGRLEGAEFDQLYRQPKETFGEDLLQTDEVVLSPGQSAHRRMERDKLAKAIAVVPLVRRPAGLSWRTAVELPSPDQRAELRFLIEEYRVERR